jgi:hypothetical protein
MARTLQVTIVALALGSIGAGCGGGSPSAPADPASTPKVESAKADLHALDGSKASGEATVTAKADALTANMRVRLTGLSPLDGCRRYAVWLAAPGELYSLGDWRLDSGHSLKINIPLSSFPIDYLHRGTTPEVFVTKVIDDRWRNSAVGPPTPPPYIGKPIVRGTLEGPFKGLSQS